MEIPHKPEILLQDAIDNLEKIIPLNREILNGFNGKTNLSRIQYLFMSYFRRLHDFDESLAFMLKNYSKVQNIELSIGITLRAVMLDAMYIYYFTGQNENLGNAVDRFLTDHIKNSLTYLKKIKSQGEINETKYRTHVDINVKEFKPLFKNEGIDYNDPLNSLVHNDPLKQKEVEMFIFNNQYKGAVFARNLYWFYSKYDHFGLLTHPFSNSEVLNIPHISDAIKIYFIAFGRIATILMEQGVIKEKEYNKYTKLINEHSARGVFFK